MNRHRFDLLLLALLAAASAALAQRTTATVAGSVRDASQAPVPDAKVVIHNLATGAERIVASNNAGFYTATALPSGPYSISISRQGFQTFTVPELVLQVDQQATVNAELQVGSVAESVNVEATAAIVDTRTATLSTVVNQKLITDLPLNGRNILQLLTVTPGTLSASGTFN